MSDDMDLIAKLELRLAVLEARLAAVEARASTVVMTPTSPPPPVGAYQTCPYCHLPLPMCRGHNLCAA